jgi:hypothetical protein
MVTRTQYIAKLEELARKHPAAPVVDPNGYPVAVTPAECVSRAHRWPGGQVDTLPRMRPPTKVERRRGVTGQVLVTG